MCRSHPCHRRISELAELFRKHLMLPVKPETCTYLKHLKSMVTHRLSFFSHVFLLANSTCWLIIHIYIFFLPANSTCWPISFFLPANSMCWPIFYRPTHRIGLSRYSQMDLIGFCYSLSHMLGKYFLRCWPLTAIGNLTPSNSSSMYAFPGKT